MLESRPRKSTTSGWARSLILIGLILLGISIGNLIAIGVLGLYWPEGTDVFGQVQALFDHPEDVTNGWMSIMLLQGVTHLFSFLVPCLVFWFFVERLHWQDFTFKAPPSALFWVLVALVVVVFMPFNSLIVEWNERLSLPPFLAELEAWMHEKETRLAELTRFMVGFESSTQLFIALIVIAVIPAVGEEVLFRGIIQRKLAKRWANVHLSIWLTATVFSAIHIQFYGFVPRLLLGALFGYLYYWSGRLSVAIFAHFVNNGFTVWMMYLHHRRLIGYDIEDAQIIPWWISLASLAVTLYLLVVLYRQQGQAERLRIDD